MTSSQLFRRTVGVFLLLSLPALIALTATMQVRLETQSRLAHEQMVQRQLGEYALRLQQPDPSMQTLELLNRTLLEGQTLRLFERQDNGILDEQQLPVEDITIVSVVRTAIQQQRSQRYIVLDDTDRAVLAACRRINRGGTTVYLLLTSDPATAITAQTRMSAVLKQAVIATWLISIACLLIAVHGFIRPLRLMASRMHSEVDRTSREDMLLAVSDRPDELGEVAAALYRLENELRARIRSLEETRLRSDGAVGLLTTVLESMIEGVIATDREQRIVFLNGGARRLLSIGDLIGPGHRLYEAVRLPPFLDAVNEAMQYGETRSLEYRNPRDDAFHLLLACPIMDGPHAGVVAVIRDVSEMRRLEAMRRDFVNGVSHELKTPLTVIQACSDTLQAGAMDDPQTAARFLKQIDDQSERLLQLILSMLQLARVESGNELLQFQSLDLMAIVRDAVADFRTVAESAGVRLHCDLTDSVRVQTDRQAARTILGNLIDNAIRYSGRNSEVRISTRVEPRGVSVMVRDTGNGIPESLLGRIFERFYRIEQDRSRERGGSGLGLAIVKHLCQSLRARISVTSKLGSGSEFTVWFPRRGASRTSGIPEN